MNSEDDKLWGVATMAFLALARGVEAMNAEGNHAKVTELANPHPSNHLPEFSLQQAMQEEKRLQEKMSHFPFHFNGPEEVPSSAEAPQSTTEIHLDKDKGKSNEEKIATLKVVTEKASKDSEFAARVRKLLAEKTPTSEQLSSVPRRKLEPPDNSNVCLDASGSNFDKEILSPTQEGTPGQEVRADLFLNVKNNCGEQADNADFIVTAAITCPPGYTGKNHGQAYRNTNPANIPDRGQAVQNTAIFTTGECTQVDQNGTPLDSVLPTTFTVSVLAEATGRDSSKSLQSVGYVMDII